MVNSVDVIFLFTLMRCSRTKGFMMFSCYANNNAEDWGPDWSPEGDKIVFTSKRDGNYEIYTMNADGSNQVNLTNNPAADIQPCWKN